MKNSLTYLTRRCPRRCEYCALRDARNVGQELNTQQWIKAFHILRELGVSFNLILGNETWLLGKDILDILQENKVAYALYTTCPDPIFQIYREIFFASGVVDNLSCGIDYPITKELNITDDSYHKSETAWQGFQWIRKKYPAIDTHGTITIHKANYQYMPQLVNELSELGVFIAVNFIHWDTDGGFDFFPSRKEIEHLLFIPEDYPKLKEVIQEVLNNPGLLQNPNYLELDIEVLTELKWHCQGNPYGGPTIDSDGTLRVCGYRKGKRTPKLSIFDLLKRLDNWQNAVYLDAMDCPGCSWSYPWQFHYWTKEDVNLGTNVFVKHAGRHIPKEKWSKRKIE